MRRALDRLYDAAFAGAAGAFAAIAVLVLLQILGRLADRALTAFGQPALGLTIPSLAEIGAFLFAAAAFLGLAGTLKRGGHVRVTLLAQRLPGRAGRVATGAAIAAALALTLWATWHMGATALDAWQQGSVSYGVVAIPLALPQALVTLGLGVFAAALLDEGAALLRGRVPAFRAAEAERERTDDTGAAAR